MTKTEEHTRYFIGTSGWTYDDWKGKFYPQDLAKSRWLSYYASQFPSVEVNATFYRTFTDQTYEKWKERAPDGFGYVLKAPREITHRKYLVDVNNDIETFFNACSLLEDHFEMILLQVAPNTPYDLERLKKALQAFPDPRKVAVEFRNARWLNPEVEELLHKVGATFCDVDSPLQKLTGTLTSDRAYLRMHGRKDWYKYNYSHEQLKEVAGLIQNLVDQGARRVYVFFNNDYDAHAPANAKALLKILGVE